MSKPLLVLVRHGQSAWNRQNRFTGWEDPPLTRRGVQEARDIAAALSSAGLTFDAAFTSYLRRAIETLWQIQRSMDLMWLPSASDWRLNERHYGALQGQNKATAARLHGEKAVLEWRRDPAVRPPHGGGAAAPDHRYAGISIPAGENLKETSVRTAACYKERIAPLLKQGQRVLLVAHGNALRSLAMHLESLSPVAVRRMEIPTGSALVYSRSTSGGLRRRRLG